MKRFTATARLLDQFGWSLSSFIGLAIGAAFLSVEGFGALAVAGSVVLALQAIGRSLSSEILSVSKATGRADWQDYSLWVGLRLRRALFVAVAGTVVVSLALAAVGARHEYYLVALSATVALALVLVDLSRARLLLLGKPMQSAVALWSGVGAQVLSLSVLGILCGFYPATFLVSWAVGLGLAVGIQAIHGGWAPPARSWRPEVRRLGRIFTFEALISVGAGQAGMAALGVFGGLSASAGARGAVLLLFPVSLLMQAISPTVVADVARHARSSRGFSRLATLYAVVVFGVLAYAAVIAQLSPVTSLLLGASEDPALSALPGVAFSIAASTAFVIPWAAARALDLGVFGMRARIAIAPFALLAPPLLASALGPALGTPVAYAVVGVVTLCCGILMFVSLRAHVRRSEAGEADAGPPADHPDAPEGE
jgi:hypothetical protein